MFDTRGVLFVRWWLCVAHIRNVWLECGCVLSRGKVYEYQSRSISRKTGGTSWRICRHHWILLVLVSLSIHVHLLQLHCFRSTTSIPLVQNMRLTSLSSVSLIIPHLLPGALTLVFSTIINDTHSWRMSVRCQLPSTINSLLRWITSRWAVTWRQERGMEDSKRAPVSSQLLTPSVSTSHGPLKCFTATLPFITSLTYNIWG